MASHPLPAGFGPCIPLPLCHRLPFVHEIERPGWNMTLFCESATLPAPPHPCLAFFASFTVAAVHVDELCAG